MKKRTQVLMLIIFDWTLCGYLALRTIQLKSNSFPDLCKTIFGNSCDLALSSTVAWQLGFSLTSLGLIYFGLLGLFLTFNKPVTDKIVVALAAGGVGFSMVLTGLILYSGLHCALCLSVHLINLLAFIALFQSIKPVFNRESKKITMKSPITQWGIALVFATVIGASAEGGILKSIIDKKTNVNLNEVSKAFQNEKVQAIPQNPASPTLGSKNAPIQLVVFSSFQCPACKAFAPALERIHQKFGENVGITFKNFPLSSQCNPRLEGDMQPLSCNAAFAALAAQNQNQFWTYHDQIFKSNLELEEKTLVSLADSVGLNKQKWQADKQAESIKSRLSDDVQLAYQLGINATPTVFINGRRVSNFQESALVYLIDNELNNKVH